MIDLLARMRNAFCFSFGGILLLALCASLNAAEPSADDIEFFEKQVRPVLAQSCFKCHGEFKQEGGLRLDSRESVLKGADSGAVVEPGDPEKSSLVEAIRYLGDFKMPPKGKLPDDQIAALTEWVRRGAPWPADPQNKKKAGEFNLASRKAEQWVFRPLATSPIPAVKNGAWPQNDVDRFVLSKLESAGLQPASAADKRTLLRRVTFDLIGLPPTPAEIDSFLADDSPRAFEHVVDRLLDSPHYGERWARHWLDLVRFAETCGHEFDFELPYPYEYRDYVIRAFNADLPYNQFVVEQIAGDLLPEPRRHPTERFNESVIGTGFWYLGEATHSPVDIRADEDTRADNQIDVFGKTFLAQTLGCARCHDHKFDAISTKDYYALSGYLQSSRFHVTCVDDPTERQALVVKLAKLREDGEQLTQQTAEKSATASADHLSKLLLATLEVLHPADQIVPEPTAEAIAAVAQARQLNPEELAKWITHLKTGARQTNGDPFHLWSRLGELPSNLTAERVAEFVKGERASLAGDVKVANTAASQYITFEDFSKPTYDGWFVTGEAFGTGPLAAQLELAKNPFAVQRQSWIGNAGAHGGAISTRLEGTLRSRTFTIEKNRVMYHAGGKGAKLNLIIDNFRMIQYPIYGGLTINFDSGEKLQWHVQDVSKWVGHNAYIEFIDPGEGFIAVDRILFSDNNTPPGIPNAVSQWVVANEQTNSIELLANAYGSLVAASLKTGADQAKSNRSSFAFKALDEMRQFLGGSEWAAAFPLQQIANQPEFSARWNELAQAKGAIEAKIRYDRHAMTMTDGTPEDDRVHLRGSPHKYGDVVPRRLMEAIGGVDQSISKRGSGRLELAQRMVDPTNPVLARVIVNRIWKHHFGAGLAATVDDFGNMGQPPTHPELLDDLAAKFINQGWSIKKLHRELVLSRTYQMSSHDQEGDAARIAEIDPQNLLLHRMNLRRLESEAIRDSILAVSGRLDSTLYGKSTMPFLTPFMIGRGRPGGSGPLDGDGRRTIYLAVRRNFLVPMLLAFDYPIPFSTIGRRAVSNVPAQALAMMNNPFVVQQSEVWGKRVVEQHSEPAQRVRAMYTSAFGRLPTDQEIAEALSFITEQAPLYPSNESWHPWADFAHVLFNTKEFIIVE